MKKTSYFIFRFSVVISLLCGVQSAIAADRATELLDKLAAGFRAMKSYEVAFTVTAGDQTTLGSYAVEGDRYYLRLGDAEVYGDASARYEVDNRRREVTVTATDNTSRNILNNPVHAFDFLGSEYAAALLSEKDGRAVVQLTPKSKTALAGSKITVTISTASMRPVSLAYDYEGEQIAVAVRSVAPLSTPLKTFDKKNFSAFEFIDFR